MENQNDEMQSICTHEQFHANTVLSLHVPDYLPAYRAILACVCVSSLMHSISNILTPDYIFIF